MAIFMWGVGRCKRYISLIHIFAILTNLIVNCVRLRVFAILLIFGILICCLGLVFLALTAPGLLHLPLQPESFFLFSFLLFLGSFVFIQYSINFVF